MSKRQVPRKIMLAVLALVLLGLGIGGWLLYRHDEIRPTDVQVIGHAGSGFLSPFNPFNALPANSMASILQAMEEHGADGVEVDVQLTQDNVLVLYHDPTLESSTAAAGFIDELSAEEVVGLKYEGGLVYDLFQDEEIITLEAMLQRFATYPELPYLHLDLRNQRPERHTAYAQTLLAMLRKYNYPLQKLVFISPNPDFLLAFRELEPQALLMLDSGGNFEETLQTIQAYKINGICANGRNVSETQVQQAKALGLTVALFGGKSRSRIAKMINMQPDAIQVDHVAAARDLLD